MASNQKKEILDIITSGRSVMLSVGGKMKIFTAENAAQIPNEADLALGNPEQEEAARQSIDAQIEALEEAKKTLAANQKATAKAASVQAEEQADAAKAEAARAEGQTESVKTSVRKEESR